MAKEILGSIPTDIKISNRQVILGIYSSGETLTPNEVSARIGLSRQTVSKTIDFYIEKGILVFSGKSASTEVGGRKPNNYELNKDICFTAINAEDEVLHFALFNLYSEILYSFDEPIVADPSYEEFEAAVENGSKRLLEVLSDQQKVYGVSLTLRGLVDSEKRTLRTSPYFTTWNKNQSLDSILRFFPDARELVVDKPVRTFARYLLDKNREEFSEKRVLVLFSRGAMAGSLIERGHIEKGRNSIIGEFGLMLSGYASSAEEEAGAALHISTIMKHIQLYQDENPESLLLNKDKPSYADLLAAYEANDPLAARGAEYLAHVLSVMIRNINLSFDADKIILLGEYAAFDDVFLEQLKKEVRRMVYYPEDYIPDICFDHTPLDQMLVSGCISNMLHEFYKDPELYH